MSNTPQLAEKVTKLREQARLTQEEVAAKLGLSRQRWIMVEKGERDLSTEELEILAGIFGIEAADFFEEVPDIEKFRQMYFAFLQRGCNDHGNIPKTKLAKLLYLADFTNYFEDLEPMSGVKYRRLEYGPVADVFFSITDDLLDKGKIGVEVLDRGAQMISLKTREAKTDRLTAKELETIKTICDAWKDKPTQEIVNFTHEQLPWKMCRDGEYIPYSLIIQEDPDHVYQPAA
ncbi:MAG TPA: type II toxin-antitoxin system antitoxin SocA domain-containing protein [Candidatus Saccharimonadales bacterium]|jgi:transcriptional regulator with XRE-family HTH domain